MVLMAETCASKLNNKILLCLTETNNFIIVFQISSCLLTPSLNFGSDNSFSILTILTTQEHGGY